MTEKQKILETVCTRMSHDLIGNIGAVANAVELLEEGDMDFIDDIKEILKVSSQTLAARLKFFRMAFGLQNANLSDSALVEKTVKEYLLTIGNKNFPIIFEMGNFDIKYSRIMMLAVMILSDMIVKGGQICAFEQNHKLFVNISEVSKISAPKREEVLAQLSGDEEEYLAQYAPVFYLKNLIDESDMDIRISDGDVFGFVIG